MNDAEFMRARLAADFVYNGDGRMTITADPVEGAGTPAPDFLIAFAGGEVIQVIGEHLPAEFGDRLNEIVTAAEREAQPHALVERISAEFGGVKPEGGPVYRFANAIAPSSIATRLGDSHRPMVRETKKWLDDEWGLWGTVFAVVRDNRTVSLCYSSRISDVVEEAGLWTDPEYRGHGYAAEVTRAWAANVRASGKEPVYSTSWDNLASQAVTRKLGLIQIGGDYTFTRPNRDDSAT